MSRAWSVLPWRRVLAATDFSQDSHEALRLAVCAARACDASVTLAHSLPHLRRAAYSAVWASRISADSPEGAAFQREVRRRSDVQLQELAIATEAPGVEIFTQTLLGEPWVELVHAVQEQHFDVVIAGSRGQSTWSELLTGSTAKKLLRHCPCDVWIVRGRQQPLPRRILAAADFSDISCRAVSRALWLGALLNAEVWVLHVIDTADVPEDLADRAGSLRSIRDVIREEAAKRLRDFLHEVPAGSAVVQQEVVFGEPWRELRTYASEVSAELIVCGTFGRSGLRGLLLGNTAERLMDHAPLSVLAIKPANFQSTVERATWPVSVGAAGVAAVR
ncbi:MAG: universal stress protein [Planctomycetota bacterium]